MATVIKHGNLISVASKGFQIKTLEMHFKLYEGYVKETNNLTEQITEFIKDGNVDQEEMPAYSELTRRLGFEYNGMVLHEYYFDNLQEGWRHRRSGRRRHSLRKLPKRRLAVTRFGKQTLSASERCAAWVGPSVIRTRPTVEFQITGSRYTKPETLLALRRSS